MSIVSVSRGIGKTPIIIPNASKDDERTTERNRNGFVDNFSEAELDSDVWGEYYYGGALSNNYGTKDMADGCWRSKNVAIVQESTSNVLKLELSNVPNWRGMHACGISGLYGRMQYGSFGFRFKPAKGNGIVSSIFLSQGPGVKIPWITNHHDEIGFKIFGCDTTKMRVDYVKDLGVPYERTIDLGFDASEGYHDYQIQWNKDELTWLVDGKPVCSVKGTESTLPSDALSLFMGIFPAKGQEYGVLDIKQPASANFKQVRYSAK